METVFHLMPRKSILFFYLLDLCEDKSSTELLRS